MRLTFVEAPWFSRRIRLRLNDDVYRKLQNDLLNDPLKGAMMPGCGGLRKMRFADPSRNMGKRGGLRIVYLYTPQAFRIDLIDVYGKDEKDDLSQAQKKTLARFAAAARQEAIDAYVAGR